MALYVYDIIGFSEKVVSYTYEMNQQKFEGSGITYDAVLRNLELIGEAATHVPDNVCEAYPGIP